MPITKPQDVKQVHFAHCFNPTEVTLKYLLTTILTEDRPYMVRRQNSEQPCHAAYLPKCCEDILRIRGFSCDLQAQGHHILKDYVCGCSCAFSHSLSVDSFIHNLFLLAV